MYQPSHLILLCFVLCLSACSLAFQFVCHTATGIQLKNQAIIRERSLLYLSDNNRETRSRPLTPAQRALQRRIREESSVSNFDKFKKAVYQGMDTLQSIGRGETAESFIVDGYSETDAQNIRRSTPLPTQSLRPTSDTTEVKRKTESVFQSVKGAVYGTVDAASKLTSAPNSPGGKLALRKPVDTLPVVTNSSRITLVNPTLLAELRPGLESSNPIVRVQAEWRLRELERKERLRIRALKQKDTIRQVKSYVYTISDAVVSFINCVTAIPGEIQKVSFKTVDFLQSIPVKVEETVDTVGSIPVKVQETATGVQESVDATIMTAKRILADVADIPNKVQKAAEDTKQNLDNAVKAVDEFQTNTKVFLGLEKPKPRPPKTPPPAPPKPSSVALGLAGSVVAATGKAAFWVTKGLAQMAFLAVREGTLNIREEIQPGSTALEREARAKMDSPKPPPKKQKRELVIVSDKTLAAKLRINEDETPREPARALASTASTSTPTETEITTPLEMDTVTPLEKAIAPLEKAIAPLEKAIAPLERAIATPLEKALAALSQATPPVKAENPPVELPTLTPPLEKEKETSLERQVREALQLAAEALDEAEGVTKRTSKVKANDETNGNVEGKKV